MRRLALLIPLAGCAPTCPTWAETPVVAAPSVGAAADDTAGETTPEELDAVTATVLAFAQWTQTEGACLQQIVLGRELEEEDDYLSYGSFDPNTQRAYVDLSGGGVTLATLHALCHALDAESGWTEAWIDAGMLTDTPTLLGEERFVLACERGPFGDALDTVVEQTCGQIDPLRGQVIDTVYPGWQEPPIGVGGPIRLASTTPALDLNRAGQAEEVRLWGDRLVVLNVAVSPEGEAVWSLDPLDLATLSWGTRLPIDVPDGARPRLLSTLPNTAPIVVFERDLGYTGGMFTMEGEALVRLRGGWLLPTDNRDVTAGPDAVWWQEWNDGIPLQRYDRHTDVLTDQPGADDRALFPPEWLLPEGPGALAYRDPGLGIDAWIIDDTGLSTPNLPVNVVPASAPLPDGRVLGQAQGDVGDHWAELWLLRDEAGDWSLSATSCEGPEDYGELIVGGGRAFRLVPDTGELWELVIPD